MSSPSWGSPLEAAAAGQMQVGQQRRQRTRREQGMADDEKHDRTDARRRSGLVDVTPGDGIVVFQGTPLDEYLAGVAPEEGHHRQQEQQQQAQISDTDAMPSTSRISIDSSVSLPRELPASEEDSTAGTSSSQQPRPTSKRKHARRARRESASSAASHNSHRSQDRSRANKTRASSTSSTGSIEASEAERTKLASSSRPHQHSTAATTRMHEQRLNTAREKLNLLLVSYLSAPHYSSLPPQDQDLIDRETVNAFLLDERFQKHHNHHQFGSRAAAALQASSSTHQPQGADSPLPVVQQQQHPRAVVTRRGQLVLLGLCSVAFFGPWTGSSSSSVADLHSVAGHSALLPEFLSTWYAPFTSSTWSSWTNALVKTAPGLLVLTGLATFFARPSAGLSLSGQPGHAARLAQTEQDELDLIVVRELDGLFRLCKRFIDVCTRLDITLEKAFTVLRDLDALAGDEEGAEDQSDETSEGHAEGASAASSTWQDLSSIEARLSLSHVQSAPVAGSNMHNYRANARQHRPKRKMPALQVRRAVFACLYNLQEQLEKGLDKLSVNGANAPGTNEPRQDELDIDSGELFGLLEMYACHLPVTTNGGLPQSTVANTDADARQRREEEEADRQYRHTMARRSLSPTLYTEQQSSAQLNALKRRSGFFAPRTSQLFGDNVTISEDGNAPAGPSSMPNDSQSHMRRASWTALGASQRGQHPSSPTSLLHTSRLGKLGPAQHPTSATPPRTRPQSIHITQHSNSPAASSPLANGKTITRDRRRRSEQIFSLHGLRQNQQQHADQLELAARRLSTASDASTSSTLSSAAILRSSTSSQGTSADPLTAASPLVRSNLAVQPLYESPSRPSYLRQASADLLSRSSEGSNVQTGQQQRPRLRARPLSMHEMHSNRSGQTQQRASFPLPYAPADKESSAVAEEDGEEDEARTRASHRSAAAAALERRLSTSVHAASGRPTSLRLDTRHSRPASLLLQSSPILSSPPATGRFADSMHSDSPAASLRSVRSRYTPHPSAVPPTVPRSKFALSSLRESSTLVTRLEKALVCHLLALKYPTATHTQTNKKLAHALQILAALVEALHASIHSETTTLSQILWEEFEESRKDAEANTGTAPSASVLLATPMTAGAAFQSTPKRRSFVACLPGSYPSSPIIEVAPATPPSDVSALSTDRVEQSSRFSGQQHGQPDFAPREPFSQAEREARDALAQCHQDLAAALKAIATKAYLNKEDVRDYFAGSGTDQTRSVQYLEARHDAMREDLQNVLKAWEESRGSVRQLREGRGRRIDLGAMRPRDLSAAGTSSSEYEDAEPSLMTSSTELEPLGSHSSGIEDSLPTPAVSPLSQATFQPANMSDLLLDSTDPRHLPPYGLQEQLYEAYVGSSEEAGRRSALGKEGKLSREERIALVRAKRDQANLARNEEHHRPMEPQASAELINELRDVVATLKARNAPVMRTQ